MSTVQTESVKPPTRQSDPFFDWKDIFNSLLPSYRPVIVDLACDHNNSLVFSCNGDVVMDFTRFYPLLVMAGWKADLFTLNPPENQRWNRSWLQNLSQSNCVAVQTAFAAQDDCRDKNTIDSTIASLCITLDFCSSFGEGYLIAKEDILQQLIFGKDAPHAALAVHIWAHLIIAANICSPSSSFSTGVIYFARCHTQGCAWTKTVNMGASASSTAAPAPKSEINNLCFELGRNRINFRRGTDIRQYEGGHTENAIKVWNASCKRLNRNSFNLTDTKTQSCYTATLGPGNVKYFDVEEFLESDVEFVISYLRSKSKNPETQVPQVRLRPSDFEFSGVFLGPIPDKSIQLDFVGIDSLVEEMPWDGKLRIQHQIALFCIKNKMHSGIYACFHQHLRLKEFALDECLNAWVKEAFGEKDITDSYLKSADHVVVAGLVFAKTDFVRKKLAAFEKEEIKRRTSAEACLLRQSQFDCFIYLMEDLRNKTFKIGRSKTPGRRERTLQSEVPEIVMRLSLPAEETLEKQLHDRFQTKRQRGEWFALTNEDLVWIVNFLKANGDVSRVIVDYQWLGEIHLIAAPVKI